MIQTRMLKLVVGLNLAAIVLTLVTWFASWQGWFTGCVIFFIAPCSLVFGGLAGLMLYAENRLRRTAFSEQGERSAPNAMKDGSGYSVIIFGMGFGMIWLAWELLSFVSSISRHF